MYPYQFQQPQFQPQFQLQQNMLPAQQILQANGKSSIDNIRLAPNSSVLIADTTAPIVWKCVSDGRGNVTSEPFDIVPHKSEEAKNNENIMAILTEMNNRITKLEEANNEQSITTRKSTKWDSTDDEIITVKPAASRNANNGKQPKDAGNKRLD